MIDAIVLAGAPNTGALQTVSNAANEALIDVNGRPILAYVLDALRGSGVIGRIFIVGPAELLAAHAGDVTFVEPEGTLLGNVLRGLAHVNPTAKALVATSDIPFLTPESVADFVKRTASVEADLYYPVVERAVAEAKYPGVHRTYAKLVDGEYTGGNIFVFRPDRILAIQDTLREAIALRKKPLRLATMLGLPFIIRFVMHKLTVADIERRVGRMLGIAGKTVVTPFAEVGVDVDKPSDLELARRLLA